MYLLKNKMNSLKLNIHNITLNLTLKIINFYLSQWWGNGDWRRTDNQKTKSAKPQHYTFNCNKITDYIVQ